MAVQLAREHWGHKIGEGTNRETGTPGREVSQKEKTKVEARANPHRRAGKSRDRKNRFGAAHPGLAKPR
jgi:hypothetical protein